MAFKKFNRLKTSHQIIAAILLVVAVVSIWRGVWGLCDIYLFPNDHVLSLVISLSFGAIVMICTHYTIKEGLKDLV